MGEYDCLLVGHNELAFEQYYNILQNMASSGGRDHIAFTDIQLNAIIHQGRPYNASEFLTLLHNEGRLSDQHRTFYNGDIFWTAISYLGSYLAKRGYTFDFINLLHAEKEQLRTKLLTNSYRLIVLTGTMYVFEQNIKEAVSFIRRHDRHAKIIAGGPYISKQAEERGLEYLKPLFKYLDADFYCYSREGEQTLITLIEVLRNSGDPATVPNLAYRHGKDFVITPRAREFNSLSDNMIDYVRFRDAYRSGWANVRISEGCPYACGFCSFPEHGNERYVVMGLDRIERELDAIRAAGTISHIFFIDATFNVPRQQFKDVMRMMIRKDYRFTWHCFFRCDQTDEETIDLMRQAGCVGVFLGLESANETVLRNMDKTAHAADFRRALPWFKRAGIGQFVSVLVGFPGETYASFAETLDFIEEIKPDFTRIQPWFCEPTTPVWGRRLEFKLKGKAYGWSHYTMDAETAMDLVVRAFMGLDGACWVPDPGYNWVSIYAMQKNGMSIGQQKNYLRLFATAAKERLIEPSRSANSPALLASLRTAAQFDRDEIPDMMPADSYAPAKYRAAEAFWAGEFRHGADTRLADAPGVDATHDIDAEPRRRDLRPSKPFTLPAASVGDLQAAYGGDVAEVVLAAYRLVVQQHADSSRATIVVSLDEHAPLPLRSPPSGFATFRDLVDVTRETLRAAEPHRRFGLFIVTGRRRMESCGSATPAFGPGYFVVDIPDDKTVLDRRLRDAPTVREALTLVLSLAPVTSSGDVWLQLGYADDAYTSETVDEMGAALLSILTAASAHPSVRIEDVLSGTRPVAGILG